MKEMFDFFERLHNNNNRPWFQEHKAEYLAVREEWIKGIGRCIASLAESWPEVRYHDAARATYRIYRDTRFSNDKTPYKDYISSSIAPPGLFRSHIGIYVQAGYSKADSGIYGGIWAPDAQQLRKIRKAIVDNADEWLQIVNAPDLLQLYGKDWCGDRLKTAPKGYDRNHPLVEYLRLKDIGKNAVLPRDIFGDSAWPEIIADRMRPLIPLNRFLIYTLFEED